MLSGLAHAKGPVIVPVTDNYNIAFSDVQFIKVTLATIAVGMLGFFCRWVFLLIFKNQDSADVKLDRISDQLARLEQNLIHIERHSVFREEVVEMIRSELEYRDGLK